MTPDTLADSALPAVPLTVEGASVLHQMMRFRWTAWRALSEAARAEILPEATAALAATGTPRRRPPERALFPARPQGRPAVRPLPPQLRGAEPGAARTRPAAAQRLSGTHHFLPLDRSSSASTNPPPRSTQASSPKASSPIPTSGRPEIEAVLERQRQAMAPRLWPEIPAAKYICFYPMDRRRGEIENWYQEPMADRQRMMHEHGMIGRRYAGEVRQIITGSIGFDDWEWGVDLFAEDPLVFKKLIYEMRFDEVSAVYALFGTFYVGVRVPAAGLAGIL